MTVLLRKRTLSTCGWNGVLLNQGELPMPSAVPDGSPISVLKGASEVGSSPALQKARTGWFPYGLTDVRTSFNFGMESSDRCVAVQVSGSNGSPVMYASAVPAQGGPNYPQPNLAWTYLYWCDPGYLSGFTAAPQLSLHNVFMQAHAASVQQMGFRALFFCPPDKNMAPLAAKFIHSINVLGADEVLSNLGLPQP